MSLFHDHILSIILFIPVAGMLVLFCIPGENKQAIRWWGNIVLFVDFLASLPLVFWFSSESPARQFKFIETHEWIPSIGAQYHLGIDGISFLLIMLTTVLGFIAVLSSWTAINERVKEYYAMFLLLQVGMLGVFMSLDFFLFYVFWEVMLVPMYFIIGVWGGARKLYAAIKFFLYTLAGSVLMLLGILTLYLRCHAETGVYTFNLLELMKHSPNWPLQLQVWVFIAFAIGFAIKVPMFPFHTWLPDAHVEAPTAGSVILAGVLLKMGTYGFIRFSLPLLPKASSNPTVVKWMVWLSIIAIVYGALVSLMQRDMKKLIAYSSVSHLGFCTLGIFALNPHGLQGSVIQQINHGISTGALFLIVGLIYERRHTREIKEFGGLSNVMPVYATLFMIVMLSSIGLPLLNGFIGEFTILQGAYEVNWHWAAWAVSGIVLGAAYMLWLYQRTMFGTCDNPKNQILKDLSFREVMTLVPLIIWAFWIGVYPKPFFNVLERPVNAIVERLNPDFFKAAPPATAVLESPQPAATILPAPARGRSEPLMWNAFFHRQDYLAIKPEILLAMFGLAVLLFDFLLEKRDKYLNAVLALVGLGFAGVQLVMFWPLLAGQASYVGFGGTFTLDSFALFAKLVIVIATAIIVLISMKYLEIEGANLGEYYALLLFAAVGMMFMVSGTDLVILFIALELMALCEYVLTGFLRVNRRSNEASVKFFLLGAFSSGLLLYGMSLLYAVGGSTKLGIIAQRLAERPSPDPLSWVAMITLLAGIYFKIAAVPFHQWTPDVYEGAPTSITAFISVAPKVASFAFFIRILIVGLWPLRAEWQALTIGVAIATMTLGNLAAIRQTNIKRFFGYSTISHVGYLLLGLVAAADGNREGLTAIVIYLFIYAFMNLGAFAVIIMMRRKELIGDEIDDFAGLMSRAPVPALMMLIFLLSLAGIPPTAGFIGKYFIFLALIETGHYSLAVLAVAYAVVALYYYFRIVVAMFMKKAPGTEPLAISTGLTVVLGVALAMTLVIGVYPQPFIMLAREAVRPFFS